MADRRGVRSASRRKTPTPQPPSKTNTPLAGRAPRTRALRSASRDVEPEQKPVRRSARQASVTQDGSDYEEIATRKEKGIFEEEGVADLAMIEEVETQMELGNVPSTPDHEQPENMAPFRSPGAASEMSGTTAISSFSMVEADFLEPRYILKHMRKLCDSADEFLEHLAPDRGSIEVDLQHIREIQIPDAEFTEDYRDYNNELMVHLAHFKTDGNSYIHIRALHRTLFGMAPDSITAQTGLDLVLYLANLVIFAKRMIHSDRNEKEIWDALRQLDNLFPSQFMRSLDSNATPSRAGESALLNDTFELALELRTQLAILVLERAGGESGFNPDDVLSEVFFRSEASQDATGFLSRGWSIAALGGDDGALSPQFETEIAKRINAMRESCGLDDESLEPGAAVDLEGLGTSFPWDATILRLLHWVRLRHRELSGALNEMGGSAAILSNVKQVLESAEGLAEQPLAPLPQESPRRKRKSFGRDRRRSGRKFDPNAPLDVQAIDALKARERLSGGTTAEAEPEKDANMADVEAEIEAEVEAEPSIPVVAISENSLSHGAVGIDEELPEALLEDPVGVQPEEEVADPVENNDDEAVEAQKGPPTSSMAMLKALKAVSRPEKENRTGSLFDRQNNAQRVEFGDGFDDTEPTPGPSTRDKGKQRAVPSSNKKRARAVDIDSDSGDDAFETEDRTAGVQKRREQAPVAKKVRIDPSSSGAPTSHQPPPRSSRDNEVSSAPEPEREEESVSEPEAPDMTEEAPPPSTYRAQHRLAMQNRAMQPTQRERKQRTAWSYEEEEAFAEYMSLYPAKYSAILNYDKQEGGGILQDRTQVNLKDKARTMAINMIKSGTGLKAGFEDIVKPTNKDGRMLMDQGYTW